MSHARQPLAIAGMGMISCLGKGAEINAAAMRCSYDGFQVSDNITLGSKGLYIALAPISLEFRGISRLVELVRIAVNNLTTDIELSTFSIPLILCISSCDMLGVTARQDRFDALNKSIRSNFSGDISYSYGYTQGRVSFVYALKKSTELLYDKGEKAVLIVSVDSLISPHEINKHLGSNDQQNRLLTDNNTNGFISGEAATAILLSKPEPDQDNIQITGFGFGSENIAINSDNVLKADGLVNATKNALRSAGISSAKTSFRIASVSGEAYFFKELALTHSRTMEGSQSDHPLWHPADSIGETGAAIGGAMVIMASYAFKKSYAIGQKALCHISNDNQERASFIIEIDKYNAIRK